MLTSGKKLIVHYKDMVFRVDEKARTIERWMTEKKTRAGRTYKCGWLLLPANHVDWNTVWRLRHEREESRG